MSAPPQQPGQGQRPNQGQPMNAQQQQQMMQQRQQQMMQQKAQFDALVKKQQSGQQLTPQEIQFCTNFQNFMRARYQQQQQQQQQNQRPGQPGQPGQPNQQPRPAQPGQPMQPGQPNQQPRPAQPGQPMQPGQPNQQPRPAQPGQPGQPARPGQPGQTGQPARPGQPGQPARPGQQPRPSQASIHPPGVMQQNQMQHPRPSQASIHPQGIIQQNQTQHPRPSQASIQPPGIGAQNPQSQQHQPQQQQQQPQQRQVAPEASPLSSLTQQPSAPQQQAQPTPQQQPVSQPPQQQTPSQPSPQPQPVSKPAPAAQEVHSRFDSFEKIGSYDGSGGSSPIDHIISEVVKSSGSTKQMQESLIGNYSSGARFDADSTRSALERDLTTLHDSVVSMSRICTQRITSIAEKLNKMEKEVDTADGIITVIKDSTGSKFMNDFSSSMPQSAYQRPAQQFGNTNVPPLPKFPGPGFKINSSGLDHVGKQINDEDDSENPLIIPYNIYNGNRIKPWSKASDYFKHISGQDEKTSFVELYNQ